jgi:hypothetical protein
VRAKVPVARVDGMIAPSIARRCREVLPRPLRSAGDDLGRGARALTASRSRACDGGRTSRAPSGCRGHE